MKRSVLFALWGGLFAICACVGCFPASEGAVKWLRVALAVACFVPPMVLIRTGDRATVALVRNLAVLSLAVTVVLMILNFLSIQFSETVGSILHYVLVIVSSPMACGQYWAMSLFLWAYLMIDSMTKLKKM